MSIPSPARAEVGPEVEAEENCTIMIGEAMMIYRLLSNNASQLHRYPLIVYYPPDLIQMKTVQFVDEKQ